MLTSPYLSFGTTAQGASPDDRTELVKVVRLGSPVELGFAHTYALGVGWSLRKSTNCFRISGLGGRVRGVQSDR